MPVKILSTSVTEPVTLAEAKAHLRVDFADDDAYILALVQTAREFCEIETGRTFAQISVEETQHGFPCCDECALELTALPLRSVSKIEYIAEADAATRTYTEMPGGQYVADPVPVPGIVFLPYGGAWPSVAAVVNSVRVTYSAGHGTGLALPAPCKQAMLLLVGFWYENREDIAINERNNPRVRSALALLRPYTVSWRT